MILDDTYFTPQEKILFSLRKLFMDWGFQAHPKLKWEDYDFYAQHKAFLKNAPILSFHDYNGALLALRPDVTLSLVRRHSSTDSLRKWYYEETVYRVPPGATGFEEDLQTGVEYLGSLQKEQEMEWIILAVESLKMLSNRSLLDLSHTALLPGLLEAYRIPEERTPWFIETFQKRNLAELRRWIPHSEPLQQLASHYHLIREGLSLLATLPQNPYLETVLTQLTPIVDNLQKVHPSILASLRLDSAMEPNITYYKGILMKGYIPQAKEAILNGGCYDPLLEKLEKTGRGFGFALSIPMIQKEGPLR